ncbi:hypothetical protein LAZ67_5002443 [Cordylochernes scorpioides]|uniref:Endonuclease n=1 Tax=Cordylochernes scorpioides TaxID=51811 RepID=A0ABY6KGC8_9ARAC|nr:hypothetical protein LAZ67_5002443 [Cordylochernes scorpioides]
MADQPVSSAELKKLRTPVRARFNKAFNELETEIKKNEVKKADVEKILRRLQTHHEKLSILNMRMEETLLRESASEDIFTAEYESVCEYEDNFSNIMTDYEALAEEDDVSTSKISGTAAMNYRLPKLEFKKFGGEPREWITFWSQFSTIDRVPQMPPETKFQYLFQATAENSEAREAVESFPPSADNYPKVIEYIKSRFREDEMLVEIHVRDLLQNVLQNVRAEGKMSVVKLYDRLETQLRALETLGVARDKFSAMLYPLVESALPEDTLRVWERSQYTVSGRGVQDKLTQLMTFLKTEVKGESRVNMAKAAFKIDNNQDAKDDRSNRKSLSKTNTGSKMPTANDLANTTQIANTTRMRNNCIFCGNSHPSQECYSGQRMHLPEKKDKSKGKNVCFWCLLPGHAFKKCRIKPRCPVCGGKHYAIMCPTLEAQKTSHLQKAELKISGESPATEQETANQFTSTTLNKATVGGVYLLTLIVKISGPKGKHNVRVLLDCGSQRSYISKRMVDALGLKRVQQVTLTHNMFGGGEIRQNKHNVYKVNVSSLNNEYMDDLKFLDQEVICGHISQVQDHTILNELKARGINLNDIYQGEERPIHMLIGSDLLSGILTGRMQILQSGVVATETKLGWTVMGPAIGNDMEDSCLIVTSLHVNSFDVQDLWKLDVLGIMDAAETKSRKDLIGASNTHFKETVKRDKSGKYIVSLPWIAGHPSVPINRRTTENRLLTTTRNVQGKMLYEELGKYGIIADIRKAFLQIQVREEDREFLRFLWWKKDQKTLKFYRHCRVVFGLTSSPFLLAATIKYHLSLPQFQDNRCAELLARSFYVDNCIISLSSTHDVKIIIKESSDIMMQAKFELRDWMWNEPGITEQDPAYILGMKWHLQTDTIAINVQSLKNIDEEKSITKRSILSACHRIFDPIQFTCPATIKIKKMVQDAWKENKSWDEPLNEDRRVEFIKWRKQALELDQIKIPRCILPIKGRTTLHVFCDASAIAYATVIFMRIENASVIVVRFVEARNRLATIKRITIPRLELLACLIGARLLVHVLENLEESSEKFQCWTDSSPALYWIQHQENWAQFVSNREHNPADLPSRGESPSKFIKSGWWEGPKWLQEKKEDWPVSKVQYDLEAIEEERRKTVVAGFVAKKPEENPWYLDLYEGKREVTLTQILRVIAWMLRFKPSEYKGDVISQEELDSAEKSLVKIIQSESIGEEDPKMKQLHVFQDKEGLWRVKTRIVNRNDDELFRLPILIPTNHPVTELIVKSVHEKMYHCGAQTLRSVLRDKFWIPKARQLVRHVIHKCPRCRRFETKRVDVPEASLPQHRKVCFVIFTCGVYRAVHLELVTSLSTEALVGAVERFVARRGCPAVIYSDNGTNLVGLRNELYRVNFGVKWKLNPPAAPWWGGWIERIVGLTKKLLRRLLGKRVFNYEEMVTILENCERVINARPLTYIAEDNDDLVPLTPEMFLREPRAEGEIDLNEISCNFEKSYEKRKRLLKDFRKKFRSEYLGLLVHHDNRKKQRQLKVGDIVLVEVENRKQINWPMGKITKVFPGTDNVRRLVEVKTKSGFMKRAVQRLFSLEVPSEDVEQGDGELKPAEDEIVREKTSGVESTSVQEKTTPVKRQRDPSTFSGDGNINPGQWLKKYEIVSKYNRWEETMKLANVVFYLNGTAGSRFDNNEESLNSWRSFEDAFRGVFGLKEDSARRAEEVLMSRAQKAEESSESYIQEYLVSATRMVETRSGKMQDPAQEKIMAEESAKSQPGATIGRDASSDPVVLNPNIDIPKYDGTEDPRPWIESLEEIGPLYHWADYIISRYAAMNMIGSANTWLNLHKISFTSWENFKSRLIEDFALDANKEEIKMRLNRMQQWNEPAIRFAEDILVLCNKVDPQMEEETKINWVIGGLKKEYSFALHLNFPKNTNEFLEICKKLDLFEKNYQERAEKSKALYNEPCSPRPHHQEQWKNATSFRRPYQNTSKPQAPTPRYYQNTSKPLAPTPRYYQNTSKPQAPTPRYYQNKPLPQVSAPRRSYTPNPEPKPVYPSKTYNKNPNSNRNRTEDGRPICFKCNKQGHVARYCRVRFVRIVEEDPIVTQDKVEEEIRMDNETEKSRPLLYADEDPTKRNIGLIQKARNRSNTSRIGDGIIRPSSSPWSFPVILVKKRDGKYRFCVDYSKLNDLTVKDVYPIPRIDEVLDTFQGSDSFKQLTLNQDIGK